MVLIAFGVLAIVVGLLGRGDVQNRLAQENIVGTPDSSIAGQTVDTGAEARVFADTMRLHTLEATEGQTFAEMGRFLDEDGNPTSDEALAATDPETGAPVANQARNIWVDSTALSTALNMSYFAESVATFVIAMGVALLLTGVGFLILTWRMLLVPAREGAKRRTASKAVAAPS
jgi:hypothetical protein